MNRILSILFIAGVVYLIWFKEPSASAAPTYVESRFEFVNHQAGELPVEGIISSRFGRRWGRKHNGIDIAAPVGTPIAAYKAGEVIATGSGDSRGIYLVIQHDGGTTHYYHMHERYLNVGDKVNETSIIGTVGDTGRSTGPHLHFEIRINGTAINPI